MFFMSLPQRLCIALGLCALIMLLAAWAMGV